MVPGTHGSISIPHPILLDKELTVQVIWSSLKQNNLDLLNN